MNPILRLLLLFSLAGRLQSAAPVILAPLPGEVLQGVVSVRGTSRMDDFASAEIAFAYATDTTGTWFRVVTLDQPVEQGLLAVWDTNAVTDGDYTLRLRVWSDDGSFKDFLVEGLRVRNYTPVETPTPGPGNSTATPVPPVMATSTLLPTPTELAPNPAVIQPGDLVRSAVLGGLLVVAALVLLSVYLWFRWKRI
jgi:hypothetical protein